MPLAEADLFIFFLFFKADTLEEVKLDDESKRYMNVKYMNEKFSFVNTSDYSKEEKIPLIPCTAKDFEPYDWDQSKKEYMVKYASCAPRLKEMEV